MKDQFVTYDIAIALKELGMVQDKGPTTPFFGYYREPNESTIHFNGNDDPVLIAMPPCYYTAKFVVICVAPLWQQAFDFLRVEKGIIINIDIHDLEKGWVYDIKEFGNGSGSSGPIGSNYEQAREAAILEAIEIAKKQI